MLNNIPIHSLDVGAKVKSPYFLVECFEKTAKNGNPYTNMTLSDKSGKRFARYWGKIPLSFANDYVYVTGEVEEYRGEPQIVVRKINKIEEKLINPNDFISFVENLDALKEIFKDTINQIKNPTCKLVLDEIINDKDIKEKFMNSPCADYNTYGAVGGLLCRTVNMLSVSEQVSDCYKTVYKPLKDDFTSDLVRTGILLFNLGCIDEWEIENSIPKKTIMGELVSNENMSFGKLGIIIHKLKTTEGVELDYNVINQLLHIISTTRWRYNLPNPPMTIESIIVNQTYVTDFVITSSVSFIENDTNPGEITAYSVIHRRHFHRSQLRQKISE